MAMPALSGLTSLTGGGSLQGGAGISETGDQIMGPGATFNFAPPPWVTSTGQTQNTMQWGIMAVAILGAAWMFTRK